VFLLGVVLDDDAIGGLRAVITLFAPLTVLAPAVQLPGFPAMALRLVDSPERARRLAMNIGIGLAVLTGGYVAIVAVGGDDLLGWIFGPSFEPFASLLWPIGIGQILVAPTVGFGLLLKAQGRGQAFLVGRIAGAVTNLALGFGLALTHGVEGAAWGMVASSFLVGVLFTVFALADPRRDRGTPVKAVDAAIAGQV
jgi:O-antigen/teichoic acid export membrane protein